jgi:four helix bundle protein
MDGSGSGIVNEYVDGTDGSGIVNENVDGMDGSGSVSVNENVDGTDGSGSVSVNENVDGTDGSGIVSVNENVDGTDGSGIVNENVDRTDGSGSVSVNENVDGTDGRGGVSVNENVDGTDGSGIVNENVDGTDGSGARYGRARWRERGRDGARGGSGGYGCARGAGVGLRRSSFSCSGVGRMSFDQLDAYRVALEYVALTRPLVLRLRRSELVLADQLHRAVLSIPCNLAEGAGEFSSGDKRRFYRYALRSSTEAVALLDCVRAAALLADDEHARCRDLGIRLVAMLTRLVLSTSDRQHKRNEGC